MAKVKYIVEIGKRYNCLIILEELPNKKIKVQCDCGKVFITSFYDVIKNKTKSCGCYSRKIAAERMTKHNATKEFPRLYSIYKHMKRRCTNPNHDTQKCYYHKGIKVCDEWHDFSKFKDWSLNNGYIEQDKALGKRANKLSIERKNPNLDYCPKNCEWITLTENIVRSLNHVKRKKYIYTAKNIDGKEIIFTNITEFCNNNNIPRHIPPLFFRKVGDNRRITEYKGWIITREENNL